MLVAPLARALAFDSTRLVKSEGYKISEVAQIMKLSEGTVKTHIFRGIQSLKKIMEESENGMR